MKLWLNPASPFARKVRILLREKELEASLEPVEPWRQREQVAALRQIKNNRSQDDARRALDEVKRVAAAGKNVLPPLLDAARARVTVGETMAALAEVLGRYSRT